MDQIVQPLKEGDPYVAGDPDWWKGAVIYQIYVRSYQDSNNDGIGDLPGAARRLRYVASLGVDAVWITPFFRSPMKDFGYDVSDYRDVDPIFGSLADFDALLAEAHSLGLKVMIDLVLSHTSDLHPWFVESRKSQDNPKQDWYVWADPKPDGSPPNNWLSVFGGVAWEWNGVRRQYYLHNFLASQPDLNFHNLEVQDALLDVVEFWLERGVDGFRLDTVNFYFCDLELRCNPALSEELRNGTIAPLVNPYNYQMHVFDKNRPDNIGFLKRLRTTLDQYGCRVAMGEVGDAQRGLEIVGEYTSGNSLVHMCYAFELLSEEPPSAERIVQVLKKSGDLAPDGWASWAFSNHDVARHTTRWNLTDQAQRLLTTLIMCARGSVCIYQGEELGLPEADLSRKDLHDPYGVRFWPEFRGRDGCRTPMIWCADGTNGGFSMGVPWLPVPEAHLPLAVSELDRDPESLLQHYRSAIALRSSLPALRSGGIDSLVASDDVASFVRTSESETVYCAFNLSDRSSNIGLPDGEWAPEFGPLRGSASRSGALTLPEWESFVAVKH